jgi:hypothetical protein
VEKEKFRKESAQKLQEEQAKIQKEYARMQQEDSVLFVERNRLSNWKMKLDMQAKTSTSELRLYNREKIE